MARRAAPIKNTSGSGFTFEDKTASFLLTCLLAGDSPFDVSWGHIVRLDFQTRAQDWYLDDILITFASGTHLALSLKSSNQITSKSLPKDFVRDAWEQFLQHNSQAFSAGSDYMGLVTSPLAPKTDEAVHELVHWACDQDEERFLIQIQAAQVSSAVKRNLFSSLKCPDDLALQYGVSDKDAVRLLKYLRFLSFDFRKEPSNNLAEARRHCRNILRSSKIEEAEVLWDRLIGIASQCRQSGGYLDLGRLLTLLQNRFALKPWPRYASDIEAIRKWTEASLASLPDKIGLKVRLPRAREVAELTKFMDHSRFVALTGPSGCGKSVVVKNWVRTRDDAPVLWLDGNTFSRIGTHLDLQRELRLNYPLEEVATSMTAAEAYCIIDGAGSISSTEGYRNVAGLISALGVGKEGSPWRILLVCQQEEWNRTLTEMSRAIGSAYPGTKLSIEGLGADKAGAAELAEVWRVFPQLQSLIRQPELRSLLLRPKILDMIATRLTLGIDVSMDGWVGESSVALWYWKTEIERPPAEVTRSQIMLRLAEQQADSLSSQVSTREVSSEINALVNERVLSYGQGRISFSHDLIGDWFRFQVLIEKHSSFVDFVRSKIVSPYWNRAVRLYGLYLLEQGSPEQWKATLDAFQISMPSGDISQDLILESVIFAANPLPLLENLWPYLSAEGGNLLRRLLGRFQYVATEANPRRLALAKTPVEDLRQATEDRLPYWPYWLPMLTFLDAHQDEAIRLAAHQVSGIANTWLRHTPSDWPQRKEAAHLGLAAANDILDHELAYRYVSDETAEFAYSAALAAGNEAPDRVRDFALRAAGRKSRETMAMRVAPEHQPVRRWTVPPGMVKRRSDPKPWPEGPLQKPNDEFKKICFNTTALFPLIEAAPDLAEEVLLSLIISTPREYEFDDGMMSGLREQECELSDNLRYHYPPFYWHYPWLHFIRTKPQQAIKTIIKLVNFATDRWNEVLHRRYGFSPSVAFRRGDARHRWTGDAGTYFWYTAHHGPHAVGSVLMTLEFWLYEQLESGTPVDAYIEQIVEGSHSVAFAGVLAAVASKHKSLLRGPLQYLMSVPEFLDLERQKPFSISPGTAMIAWSGKGSASIEYARDWHSMPHRKQGLDWIAHSLMLTDPDTHAYFKQVRKEWKKRLRALLQRDPESAAQLERLISAFTPEHHTFEEAGDGQGVLITHHLPEVLEEQARPERERAERRLLQTAFPMQCRQLLDGETTLSMDEDRDAFWLRCQQSLATPFDEGQTTCCEDITCGTAAVLLLKHTDWLIRYPDRNRWCREQILNTILNPPKSARYDSNMNAVDWCWHSFCAETIPHLWAEDIGSPQLRECVVLMAFDFHYRTVGSLFSACHAERHLLGGQFKKLQNLIRHWAMERIDLHQREDALNNGFILRPGERRSFRAITALDQDLRSSLLPDSFLKIVKAFIDDTLSADLLPLDGGLIAEPEMNFGTLNPHERHRNRYLVDIELIQWAYSHLPSLDSAHDPQERQDWIAVWKEMLECLLRTLRPISASDGNKEVGETPYEVDGWILRSIAILLPQMTLAEHPEQLWQPILDLGWQAHHWVEDFLSGFFTYNLSRTAGSAFRITFIQLWSDMIDYADASPMWNFLPRTQGWHIHDNWENLMGLNWLYSHLWDNEHQPVLLSMQTQFKGYSEKHLQGMPMLKSLCRLLCSVSAKDMRLAALLWIEPHVDSVDADQQTDADGQLGLLLAECWQVNQDELKGSPKVFECYMRLVKFLADRQSPIALEIQNRVIAG